MSSMHSKTVRYLMALLAVGVVSVGGGYIGGRLSARRSQVQMVVSPPREEGNGGLSFDGDVSATFQQRFREVAATTLPVVVEINTVSTVTQTVPSSPFSFFFGRPGQPREREYQQRGLGSGVIVATEGDTIYVLTNNHVAGEADEIEIVMHDGRTFSATIEGTDELLDLALVSFTGDGNIPVATLGDAANLEIGDWVFAVGNPLGFESSVTAGIVSAKERDVSATSGMSGVTSYIQTDASINQGNSGGALVNLEGEVVGINTWIASRSGGSDGIGFAIPINMARRAIGDFIERGEVAYSWLGVLTGVPTAELRDDLGAQEYEGAFVYGVYERSPAANGGLRAGDIIVRVGEVVIADSSALVRTIAALEPQSPTPITVVRGGQEVVLEVRTAVRAVDAGGETRTLWPGLAIYPLTREIRNELELSNRQRGVIVASVTEGTPAEQSGMRQGDIITALNGEEIASAREFYQELAQLQGEELQFRVLRDGNTIIIGFMRQTT